MDRIQLLERWLESVSAPDWVWFAKRLSANDTGATGTHQVGLCLGELCLALLCRYPIEVQGDVARARSEPERLDVPSLVHVAVFAFMVLLNPKNAKEFAGKRP